MCVGAVTSVKKFKNPVKVARLVMEKSDHCILSGEGAHQFAETNGIKLIDNQELIHEKALDKLAKCKSFIETINSDYRKGANYYAKIVNNQHRFEDQLLKENELNKLAELSGHDTVGAVAMDHLGNLGN